jgi:hypothetical protein
MAANRGARTNGRVAFTFHIIAALHSQRPHSAYDTELSEQPHCLTTLTPRRRRPLLPSTLVTTSALLATTSFAAPRPASP